MDSSRARRISESFADISAFVVENTSQGLYIHYLGHHAFFTQETCFWPFAFNLARVSHEEGQIAEIEAALSA